MLSSSCSNSGQSFNKASKFVWRPFLSTIHGFFGFSSFRDKAIVFLNSSSFWMLSFNKYFHRWREYFLSVGGVSLKEFNPRIIVSINSILFRFSVFVSLIILCLGVFKCGLAIIWDKFSVHSSNSVWMNSNMNFFIKDKSKKIHKIKLYSIY